MSPSNDYEIVSGADSKWTKDSENSVVIEVTADAENFVGVKVDGKDTDAYTLADKDGNLTITFDSEYLNILEVGEHEITIVFADGEAKTTLTVEASDIKDPEVDPDKKPDPDQKPDVNPDNGDKNPDATPDKKPDTAPEAPNTGDETNMIYPVMGIVFAAAAAAVVLKKKRA